MLQEHKNILQETPLFFSIEPNYYEELLEKFEYTLEYFESGEEIAREFRNIGILLSGEVSISKESIDNSLTVVEKIKIGEVFGEVLTCLNTEDSAYRIIASTDAEVILIPYANLLKPSDSEKQFTLLSNLMRILARRNLLVERKLEVLSKKTLSDKILTFLAIQREITGNNTFVVPYSRLELSEYLCVDRSALSRELSNLMKAGLIKYKKNLFTIMTSYEDVDLDEFDDLEGINDFDDEDDELDLTEITADTTDITETTIDAIEDIDIDDIDIDDIDIDDIITIDGISIDDIDIDIDDSEIDAILNDDEILIDTEDDILTESSLDLKGVDELLKEDVKTVEDDFFAQEYAKLDDIEIDNISTIDVINEIMDDGSYTTDTSFMKNINFFSGNLPTQSTGEYDNFDETEEESAMDDEQQEEQARVFAQFVDQAKVIATKKLDQNENPDELENISDRLVEKILPKTNDGPQESPVQELPIQEPVQEVQVEEVFEDVVENVVEEVVENVVEDVVEFSVEEDQAKSKRDIPFEQYVQETIQEAIGEPIQQAPQQPQPELETDPEVEPQATIMPAGTQVQEIHSMEDFGEDFTEEFTQQQVPPPVEQHYEEYSEQEQPPVEQHYEEYTEQIQPPVEQHYEEYTEQEQPPVEQHYEEYSEQEQPPVEQHYEEYSEQVQPPVEQHYEEYTEQEQPPVEQHYEEYPEQEQPPVDDRDANLLLEPIDTLVDKITDELAPKSIEEAVEKLKDELLPLFARDPKDIAAEKLITKSPISDNIGFTENKSEDNTTPAVDETSPQEIAEDIVELFSKSKSKNKKQAKSRGFNLFNKFKRE